MSDTKIIFLSPNEARKLRRLLARVEALRGKLAKDRDALRDVVSDLEALIDSIDFADEELSIGLRAINDSVDRLSQ